MQNITDTIQGGGGGQKTFIFHHAAIIAVAAGAANAADCYWAGGTSSAWETAANWTTTARKPTNDGGYFRSDKFNNNFKSGSRAYIVQFNAAETNLWRTYFSNCGTASAPIVLRASNAAYGLTGGDSTNSEAKNHEGIYIGTNMTGGNSGDTDSRASSGNAYVRFESGTYATQNTYSYFFLGNNSYDGHMTVAGATINPSSDFKIFSGSLTVESGNVNVTAWTRFENNSRAKSVNLDGGLLKTATLANLGGSGAMTVNFNGGTLKNSYVNAQHAFIDSGITVNVKSGGGTINTGAHDVIIGADMGEDPSSIGGGMKFIGGGSVALNGAVGWKGGTTIEAGTTLKVDTVEKKDALLGTGFNTLKVIPTAAGTYTLITITGDGVFSGRDFLKAAIADGYNTDAVFSLSDDEKSLKVTIGNVYSGGVINQTTPTLVFPGATLADLATHTIRARFQGSAIDADGTEATFFNRVETVEDDILTKVTYQLQVIDENGNDKHYTKAAKVEFTADVIGVYAKLIDGDYINYGTPSSFGAEPLTVNAGIIAYEPYDFKLVKPANAISVNFCYDANELQLTSSSRFGAGDYAVPYTSWNNMSVSQGSSATFGGATFKQTKTSGRYRCSNLSSTKDLRYGYLDDGGQSVVVDITDIPYEFYRVVTYHATDVNLQFGHVTINGTDYTGVTDATVKGNAQWGSSGASNYAFGLREGVNYLVSDVMTDRSVTITGHRDKVKNPTCRGCIAAIQIVEYKPETYTATIDDGGEKTFSALSWDKTLPALLTAGDKVVVNVNEDTVLEIDAGLIDFLYAVEFNVAEGKTLELAGADIPSLYVNANGSGQIVASSVSQLSGKVRGECTLLFPGQPVSADLTEWTGTRWTYDRTARKAVLEAWDGSLRSLSGAPEPIGFSGVDDWLVPVEETREEFGKGSLRATDVPAWAKIRVVRADGTTVDVAPEDGTATLTEAPQICGAATAFDATYTNTVEYAYRAPGWNAGGGQDVKPPTYNNTANDGTTGMYILHHPWVSGVAANINALGDFTLVIVGKMSPSRSTQFIHIGSASGSLKGILITTTENEDEVLIAKNAGNTVDAANGVRASVPNAATARHAYIINRKGNVFEVWVDGVKRGQFDAGDGFVLGSTSSCDVQIGSDVSGTIRDAGIYKGVPNTPGTETGVVNLVRLFDYAITDAQAEAVFAEYPYVSQGGLYERTVASDGSFSEADAWTKSGDENLYAVPAGATVDEVYYNPSATLTVNAAAKINVNADAALDTLTVGGTAPVTFKADGTHSVSVLGAAVLDSPVTNEYGALNLSGTPIRLGEDGAICFDCSGFDISGIFETRRFQLTGIVDRDDEKVTFVPPQAVLSRTVTFGYNATGSCYEFTVTTDRSAGTVYYKSGTFSDGSSDLRVVLRDGEGNETETALFPGDNVVFDDSAAGANALVQFGETLPANVTFSFGEWTGCVIPELPSSMYVWSGAAGDGKANTDGNWYGGSKPPAGAAVYIPSKTDVIDNDIAGFAPASITFGPGVGSVTIGGSAITGVAAVTNLSTSASHVINAPVAFSGEILVVQGAVSWEQRTKPVVRFARGVTGTTFAEGTARYLDGVFNLSTGEGWVANTHGNNNRWGIPAGSSLALPSATDTVELELGDSTIAGGAFTTGVMRASTRLLYLNYGEYVVTNELVFTLPSDDRHVARQYSDGAFKFEKITLGDQGKDKWFYFANEGSNYNYTKNIWIGAGGMNFAEGARVNTAYSCGRWSGDVVYLRPWHSDYTIATKPEAATDFVVFYETHIGTVDENGVARTVTCNGRIRNLGTGRAIVEGSGTFVVNSPAFVESNSDSGTWTVTDGATLALTPSGNLGIGTATVNSGATLALPETGTVTLTGPLDLKAGSALSFKLDANNETTLNMNSKTLTATESVNIKFAKGSVFAPDKVYTLVSGANLAEGDEANFALPEGNRGQLSVVEGNLVYTAPKYFIIKVK